MSDAPHRVLVWDLPVRIFHWLLVVAFLAAWTIAVSVDDESRLFALHSGLGLFVGALVAFRLVWGLIGTRHARFGAFAYRPAELRAYLKGLVAPSEREFAGHNPASGWATFAMLALLAGLIATGFLLGRGREFVEDLHEVLAHSMLAVAGIHVLGVAWHTVRRRDPIALAMLDGRKRGAASDAIRSTRPVSALVLGVLLVAWASGLWRGYDPATRTLALPVVGTTLSVGESEDEAEEEHGEGSEHEREHHEDDDD